MKKLGILVSCDPAHRNFSHAVGLARAAVGRGVQVYLYCIDEAVKGIARWDAYVNVSDPDTLAAEFASRGVEFFVPLQDTQDGLRGFEIEDADGYLLFFGRTIDKASK